MTEKLGWKFRKLVPMCPVPLQPQGTNKWTRQLQLEAVVPMKMRLFCGYVDSTVTLEPLLLTSWLWWNGPQEVRGFWSERDDSPTSSAYQDGDTFVPLQQAALKAHA
ncbi:hypothetical protein PoB_007399100 [Plakobranchus ocellatus]|uniref:Uncharacterized protein n=1 Tax=Plakobranchus ocellatus TaxID=259542 RepID=A0AAV4DUA5_9GAST|nr:hypothetical protein PoB_007399100 [Plakobranchus ocellatus]